MRPEILYPLFANISSLKGVGDKAHKFLNTLLDGDKIVNLLWHLPSGIVDRSYSPKLVDAVAGRICTLKIRVIEHIPPKTSKQPYRVIVEDDTDQLELIFFKIYADSIKKNLPLGSTRIISGKIENYNGMWQMPHPDFIVKPEQFGTDMKKETVYPLTAGITNKMMCKFVQQALAKIPSFAEWQNKDFVKQQNWKDFKTALTNVHHPKYSTDLEPWCAERSRLAYDELLANQLALVKK